MMPIAHRVVRAKRDSAPLAGGAKFLHHVAAERRTHDVVVGLLGVPQAEAVVMLGREHHVLHAGRLGNGHPLVGIEAGGVELGVQVIVVGDGRFLSSRPADFMPRDAHRPPMDEHAEPHVLPPLQRRGIGLEPRFFLGMRRESSQ